MRFYRRHFTRGGCRSSDLIACGLWNKLSATPDEIEYGVPERADMVLDLFAQLRVLLPRREEGARRGARVLELLEGLDGLLERL